MRAQYEMTLPASVYGYTPAFPAAQLLALQINVIAAANSTITVTAQHSSDGQHWDDVGGTAVLNAVAYGSAADTSLFGYLDCAARPLHRWVRLKVITLSATTVRVRILPRGRWVPDTRQVFAGMVPSTAIYSAPCACPRDGQAVALQTIAVPVNGTGTLSVAVETGGFDDSTYEALSGAPEVTGVTPPSRAEGSFSGGASLTRAKGPQGRLKLNMATAGDLASVSVVATVWRKPPRSAPSIGGGCGCGGTCAKSDVKSPDPPKQDPCAATIDTSVCNTFMVPSDKCPNAQSGTGCDQSGCINCQMMVAINNIHKASCQCSEWHKNPNNKGPCPDFDIKIKNALQSMTTGIKGCELSCSCNPWHINFPKD